MGQILVVGGAGYVGSHMVQWLCDQGESVIVLDDFSSGHPDTVAHVPYVQGDVGDVKVLEAIFGSQRIETVMHFASSIQVGESVREPARYYHNNVSNTLTLLTCMSQHKVPHFVFSSTAALFGDPVYVPIDESHVSAPINPYGRSKWMVEQMLPDFERAYGLRSVCLRYFNAAGADPHGRLGERHDPETHLIPLALRAAMGRLPCLTLFGHDYDTPDGTCVRDYVHVHDLCQAHWQALLHLRAGRASAAFNLGNGTGFSVQQVLRTIHEVTGQPVPMQHASRRAGDPARLVANSAKAQAVLGWRPRFGALHDIVAHAWAWEHRVQGLSR